MNFTHCKEEMYFHLKERDSSEVIQRTKYVSSITGGPSGLMSLTPVQSKA